jgi:hypothetical protein
VPGPSGYLPVSLVLNVAEPDLSAVADLLTEPMLEVPRYGGR